MADRSIKLLLSADVKGLVNGLRTGAKAAEDFGRNLDGWAKKNEAQLEELGKGATLMGAGLTAAFALSLKTFADFDKAMSSVQAATHETEGNMNMLREAAIAAGADTAFSAAEAAGAIEELAKAGVSTADIMGGGLDGALALAAAGNLDVAKAAELSASALTQFKLSGEEVPHVADLLAAGAGKAQGSVEDLGAALNQSGLVAAQAGLTLEETTGGLAAFAAAGLVGSDAGTSFKTMLQAITPNSDKAAKAMEELGISAFDSQGNFIGLSEYAGVLKGALSALTDEQRNSTMETIFGSDAVRAAAVLYEQGAEGIQKWEDAVNDAGYAAETAAIMQNNLAGDLEKLGGSFDTVFLQSGSAANDMLRGLVQTAEDGVDAIGSLPPGVLNMGAVFTGVAGGAALLGGAALTLIPKIRDTVQAMRDIAPVGSRAEGAIKGVGKAAAITAGAVAGLAVVGPTISSWVSSGNQADPQKLAQELFNIGEGGKAAEAGLGNLDAMFNTGGKDFFSGLDVKGLEDAFRIMENPDAADNVDNILSSILSFGTRGSSNIEFAKKNFAALDQQLASMASSGSADAAAVAYEELRAKADAAGVPVEKLVGLFPSYNQLLANNATAAQGAAQGGEVAAEGIQSTADAAQEAADALKEMLDGLVATGQIALSEAAAHRDFEAAVDDARKALEENGKTLDITTEKGRSNQAALDGIASSALGLMASQQEAGASASEMAGSLERGREAFIEQARAMGVPKKEAAALADQYGLIPEEVYTAFYSNTDDLTERIGLLHEQIQSTPDKTVTISDNSGEIRLAMEALGYVVETLPNGMIRVSETGTDATGKKIDNTAGKKRIAKIDAQAITGAAEAALNHVARNRSMIVQVESRGSVSVPKGAVIRPGQTGMFSSGGYTGPGGKYEPAGVVHRDEFVIRKESRRRFEERNPGMLDYLNQTGTLPGYASGGRVGWAEGERSKAKQSLSAAQREVKAARVAVRSAGKSKSKADDKKADQRLTRAEKALDAAESRYRDAVDRVKDLKDTAFQLERDRRRGNITGDMSTVDQLFDWANDPNLSKGQRNNLRSTAYRMERELLSLEKRAESLAGQLEKATERRDELLSVRNSVASGLRGETSLEGLMSEHSATRYGRVGVRGLAQIGRQKVQKLRGFEQKLKALGRKGYAGAIVQEIAEMGVDAGTEAADILLDGNNTDRDALNAVYRDLDKYSQYAGDRVTDALSGGMYKSGLAAAEGLVRGLEKSLKSVDSASYKMGKTAEGAFKRALGIKSPSRVMMAAAGDTADGFIIGLGRKRPDVDAAMANLVSVPQFSTSVGVPGRQNLPAISAAPVPAVYVQNPFTGEYLLAQVDGRADARLDQTARKVGARRR